MNFPKNKPLDVVFIILCTGGIYLLEMYDKLDIIIKYPNAIIGFTYLLGRYIPYLSHKLENILAKKPLKADV